MDCESLEELFFRRKIDRVEHYIYIYMLFISRKGEIEMKKKSDSSKFFRVLLPSAEFRASVEHEKRFQWIINFILNEAAGTYVNAESVGYLHLR